jgi:hypothetical protein
MAAITVATASTVALAVVDTMAAADTAAASMVVADTAVADTAVATVAADTVATAKLTLKHHSSATEPPWLRRFGFVAGHGVTLDILFPC